MATKMKTATNTVEDLARREYKYGFVTDIESDALPPGLNEGIVVDEAEALVVDDHVEAGRFERLHDPRAGTREDACATRRSRRKK